MYQFTMAETVFVAAALGIAFAFSFREQYRFQLAGLRDKTKTPLFTRITYAGLSAAILCAVVTTAVNVNGLDRYVFIGIFFLGIGATWLRFYVRRSNSQFESDS